MQSSYNVDKGRAPMGKITAPKPKPTKCLSKGSARHFVPTKANEAFSTQGGTKK